METFSASLAFCAKNSPVSFPHKGQWQGALVFSLICAWTNSWVNNRDAGDLRRHRAHYEVTVMHSMHYPLIPRWYWTRVNIACSDFGFCIIVSFFFPFLVYKSWCWNIAIRSFIVLGIAYYIAVWFSNYCHIWLNGLNCRYDYRFCTCRNLWIGVINSTCIWLINIIFIDYTM